MKKYLTYLIIIGLMGILALAAFPIRNYYLFLKEPTAPLTNAIPEETVFLVKAGSLNRFIEILRASELFELLKKNKSGPGVNAIADQIAEINSRNSFFNEVTAQNEMFICMVPDKELSPEMLFLTGIGKTTPAKFRQQIEGILKPGLKIAKFNHIPTDLFSIKTENQEIWFYVNKGILAIAFNRYTLEQSCNSMARKKNLMNDHSFLRLSETSGKRVDGVLMINNKNLIKTVLQIKENNPLDFNGSPFNGWTSLDLNIEKNKVLMDGFTVGGSGTTILSGQETGEISSLRLLPSGTAFAVSLSISNQQAYTSMFSGKDTMHITGYDSANQTVSTEIFRHEEHLRSWIGNSISFAAMPRFFNGDKSARITLIELKNADSAAGLLKPYLQPYQGEIKIFAAPTLPRKLWGSLFATDGRQFCLMTNQLLVISPSLQLLEEYQKETAENRLYGSTSSFRDATALMLEKSNVTIIANPSISGKYFKNQIRGNDSRISQKWTGLPASAEFLCLQFNAGNPLLYTHAFALLKPGTGIQANSVRDKQPSSEPVNAEKPKSELPEEKAVTSKGEKSSDLKVQKLALIQYPASGKNLILTFHKNTIQAYSGNGNKLWSFICKEDLQGEVYEIGLKQQKGKYFLVPAGKLLHIIDQNGKESKSSPVKLPVQSTPGMAVFDYDHSKDYRLLYQGKDNRIYNITIDGKELAEWEKPELKDKLSGPALFFRTGGKDYIVLTDVRGRVIITDRRGRQRIKVEESFQKSNGGGIFENRTNNKGRFLTVSANGNLAYIGLNGKTSESRFGEFGNNPWFDYRDFNGDGENEFIFCGNGRIEVFTKMKKTIASASLPNAGFSKPFIYSSTNQSWLAVRDQKSGKVLVLNSKSQLFKDETILSDIDPVIFLNEGEKRPVLLTVHGGKLTFTLLEK